MAAVILLTRGIFSDVQSPELDLAVGVVQASGAYAPVVGAYVDHGSPNLAAALDTCAEAGATHILVAPIYTPIDRFLSTWIPQVLRRWLRRRPQFAGVQVTLADSVGTTSALGRAALENIAAAEQSGGSDPIREDLGVEYANPGFNTIPAYRYQALVCVGPRCATRGSSEVYERVREAVARHRLTGKSSLNRNAVPASPDAAPDLPPAPTSPSPRVSVIRTGCLFPCNLGPVMVVHPGDTWYCAVSPEMVDEIVEQHFVHDRVVTAYTRQPGIERHDRPVPADAGDIVEDPTIGHRSAHPRPEGAPVA